MSVFTQAEIDYLQSQRLGRLATVNAAGQPHVVPVGFRYDPESDTIAIGGHNFAESKKVRDVKGNPRVAFVVDDLTSVNPWRVRGIEIRGAAEYVEGSDPGIGPGFDTAWFRITPRRIISWGLGDDFRESSRRPVS